MWMPDFKLVFSLIILASCRYICFVFVDDVATGGSRSFRVMKSFSQQAGIQGGLGAAFPSHATFPHYAIPQGLPYHVYGYSLSLSLSRPYTYRHMLSGVGTLWNLKVIREGASVYHMHAWRALWQATLVNGEWACKLLSCMPLLSVSLSLSLAHKHKVATRALVTHDSRPLPLSTHEREREREIN